MAGCGLEKAARDRLAPKLAETVGFDRAQRGVR